MKSIKNHLGFILPLIALLFAVQFSSLGNEILKQYEELMSKDYNIVVVSNKELNLSQITASIKEIKSLNPINPDTIVSRLSNEISSKNLSLLKNALPNFYSIKLNEFASSVKLQNIRARLLNIDGVTQVETFLKTHDKIYKALMLSRYLSLAFVYIIASIGVLLMLKQVKIWLYEHTERIEIMTLFGAGFWLKSSILYKTAIIDSIIASIAVIASFYFAPELESIKSILLELDLNMPRIDIIKDGGNLLLWGLSISIVAVSLVMKTHKKIKDEA